MGFPSTPFPASQLSEHRLSNSFCQIQDELLSVTIPVMCCLIFIAGLLSNAVALWLFSRVTQHRTSITVSMRNLAHSDLVLSLCLPFCIALQSKREPLVFCNISGAFFYHHPSVMHVSITFLSLIRLDCYLKIIQPLQELRVHTVSFSTMASGVIWLVHTVFMLPYFFDR